jgi:serine phosphatase RsbU (regulator of sigma subunit)
MLQNPSQKSNPALGLFDQFNYVTASVPLHPGDRFILFTDGVYDVEKNGELLGPEWLRSELKRRQHQPLAKIFDELIDELRSFCPEDEFCDDMCLVGMEVAGK